jgi:hypothetical protein
MGPRAGNQWFQGVDADRSRALRGPLRVDAAGGPRGTGARKKARHGAASNGAACKGGRRGLRPEATQAAPRSSRQSEVVAVLPIVTHTPTPPISRLFPRPSIRRQEEQPSQNGSRQREPAGRSPAQRAGKAERSDRRAREDYGWGWAGGVIKPNHAPNPTPFLPNSSRQREPAGRSPAQRAGKAERSECRAREDYGWGWAGGVTNPNHVSGSPRTESLSQPQSVCR